jgi:hypothetical protein
MRLIPIVLLGVATMGCVSTVVPISSKPARTTTHQFGRITQDEISRAMLDDRSAYEAIRQLDPLMLIERPSGFSSPGLVLLVDGVQVEARRLLDISARDLETVERQSSVQLNDHTRSTTGLADVLVIRTRRGGT